MTSSPQGTVQRCDGAKGSFPLLLERVVTEMINREVVDETLSKSLSRWSRSNTIMQALVDKIANDPGFIEPVAAFFKQGTINAVEKKLNRVPPVTKEIQSPPDPFPSAFYCTTMDKKSKARRSGRRRHY